jgi:hypothetical protein
VVDQRRNELGPNSNYNFRLQTEGTNDPPCCCLLLQGYVTVFTAPKFMANDGRTCRMPAPRDRPHNRRDAIANVVIDW